MLYLELIFYFSDYGFLLNALQCFDNVGARRNLQLETTWVCTAEVLNCYNGTLCMSKPVAVISHPHCEWVFSDTRHGLDRQHREVQCGQDRQQHWDSRADAPADPLAYPSHREWPLGVPGKDSRPTLGVFFSVRKIGGHRFMNISQWFIDA